MCYHSAIRHTRTAEQYHCGYTGTLRRRGTQLSRPPSFWAATIDGSSLRRDQWGQSTMSDAHSTAAGRSGKHQNI
ncbi:hypothetical protein GDO78_015832 [Eleutherodactylus coqui]|uniref:Uncharacterized protein n=1 Tax=Eleutherodactylus coqui TaxID=57060 RepID=A0A8J6ED72_ELECQ|nr:hypothetical protein GDO78_015832 [Eleutherodactylus coqui]